MGREIRRVPPNWQHPRDDRGRYRPLYNGTFDAAARQWLDEAKAWDDGTHETIAEDPSYREKYPYFWEYGGNPPEADCYRPDFGDTATAYQMYETVSEGTPVSPVFETEEAMVQWLISQGRSEHAARAFVRDGWAPSMVMVDGRIAMGVDAHDLMSDEKQGAK